MVLNRVFVFPVLQSQAELLFQVQALKKMIEETKGSDFPAECQKLIYAGKLHKELQIVKLAV